MATGIERDFTQMLTHANSLSVQRVAKHRLTELPTIHVDESDSQPLPPKPVHASVLVNTLGINSVINWISKTAHVNAGNLAKCLPQYSLSCA